MSARGGAGIIVAVLLGLLFSCSEKQAEKGSRVPPEMNVLHQEEKHSKEEHAAEEEMIFLDRESLQRAGIEVEEAMRRPLKQEPQLSGAIQANEDRLAHVGSRIPGRVVDVAAGLGDRVEKGSRLVLIDSPELGQAQSSYLTAKAKRLVSEKGYERARTLVEQKVIGTGELQRREGEYLSARAEFEAAESRLRLLGMTKEEVFSLGTENAARSEAPILAPLSGTIIERHATVGELVEPVKTLFTIADLSLLWGIADVPERDLAQMKKGAAAAVSVSAYPEERFKGKVSYLADTIDPATRTLKVRIEIENPRGKLKPQMFATFRILTEEAEPALALPASAVQREGAQSIVFVERETTEKGSRFEKRPVSLGAEVQGFYPALSGLQPGERVVTKGAFVLKSEADKEGMEEGHAH